MFRQKSDVISAPDIPANIQSQRRKKVSQPSASLIAVNLSGFKYCLVKVSGFVAQPMILVQFTDTTYFLLLCALLALNVDKAYYHGANCQQQTAK